MTLACEACGRPTDDGWGRCFACGRRCCRRCKGEDLHICRSCWETADGAEADRAAGIEMDGMGNEPKQKGPADYNRMKGVRDEDPDL